MKTQAIHIQGFIRIINCPKAQEGSPITIEPIEDKGAKVVIVLDNETQLSKTFLHPKRPAKAQQWAESCATSLPPRTTSHCLIAEFGFELPEETPAEKRQAYQG